MNSVRLTALTGLVVAALLFGGGLVPALAASDVALMTTEELKGMIDDENILVLDVRAGKDWKSSEFKIKGAVRADPGKLSAWGKTHDKEKKLVLYCA